MNECKPESFFRSYDLTKEQKQPKDPAAHQHDALNKLQRWYQTKHSTHHGGILVLPTGGGKTFTAMRFLCTHPLSEGYKVLWLAHTHHLLEQALYSLESEVKLIRNKQKLNVRVVSGTTGHFRPSQIQTSDDVLICTLQTITRAYNNGITQLKGFLNSVGKKLVVVFDEAHHSPAPSYCRFIKALRKNHTNMYLLGLTATPTHTDKKKVGWLSELFPQEIIYQISPKDLMAAGVLAKPIFETSRTTVTPEFDENKYQQWVKDFRDLPEQIITKLAENRERNAFIAKTYADNKERYGKTIIFADRWFQCEQICGFLKQYEIKVDTIYSHIDADPSSADARNKRNENTNKQVLKAFHKNELDVLINVRMLTEGTDVPDVQTVFLTRQTTSQILMTQMVGRALRGTQFGGTESAYIVSFIDNWQQAINWAEYEIEKLPTIDTVQPIGERVAMQLISIDLLRRLIEQINSGVNVNTHPFITQMPLGWYRVQLEVMKEEDESTEIAQQLVMVFEHEKASYENFIQFLQDVEESEIEGFLEPTISFDDEHEQIVEKLKEGVFSPDSQSIGGDLMKNLLYITCHMAQNDREAPTWFDFKKRKEHNLDDLAQKFIDTDLGSRALIQELQTEYDRIDRYWKIIYHDLNLFKSQYDACANRILINEKNSGISNDSSFIGTAPPDLEPSEEIKKLVKKRDKYQCLCCGEDKQYLLQIDHINPKYRGGNHSLDNLQTLCKVCNKVKGTEVVDFCLYQTPLNAPKTQCPHSELIRIEHFLVY
ncbi:MAG: hypothetical protein CLLPBCKN_002627 [Chroococcidiopsis cubana SAG 39.79]|uniref:Helicase n=1 Tax=Chroococcidiopsis cubana SAG 39.79 TaxID=388085 RepID=A0AB37UEG8_9CYAN|nr:DEAD/DEAH box helicase family protein [Chroococcidiopsis cubana]MDZ4873231.1 hypothetical protein [Chroococcidiopsis cubana SAG 39.79]PSB59834.1 hypothetical protein C7B79_27995 [Chroococcidiopsis cubana CCALA 043]RUT07481.1 hypothetical protein DSM107010_50300 [Chroococcidiopsis cubana SAG 39.79]